MRNLKSILVIIMSLTLLFATVQFSSVSSKTAPETAKTDKADKENTSSFETDFSESENAENTSSDIIDNSANQYENTASKSEENTNNISETKPVDNQNSQKEQETKSDVNQKTESKQEKTETKQTQTPKTTTNVPTDTKETESKNNEKINSNDNTLNFDFNKFISEFIKSNTQNASDVTPKTDTSAGDNKAVSDYEKEVVNLVNNIRKEYGLSPLKLNSELSAVARLKSSDMREKGYFSHTSPTYGSPFDMMKTFGIKYRTAGENIAMGYRTPQAVVDGWMNSKGHRENILNSSFTEIGVGYIANGNYWTQMFIG